MSKIIAIVAMGKNREIGQENDIPWRIRLENNYRDDMRNFVQETKGKNNIGHPCVMTSVTWNSIDDKYKPLSGRPNIVVTSKNEKELPLPNEVIRAKSPIEAVHKAEHVMGGEKVFICGGTYLYQWAIDHADELHITEIPEEFPNADAFFPEFLSKGWVEFERTTSPNGECAFVKYKRSR